MIVFGGQDGSANPCSTFSDVWVLGNSNGLGGPPVWLSPQIVNNSHLPSGQNAASAVYDAVRGVMTIFGGTGMVDGVCTASNAVWQLSTSRPGDIGSIAIWSNIISEGAAGSPSARSFASAVYDGTGGRLLLFGGADSSGNYLNDVLGPFQRHRVGQSCVGHAKSNGRATLGSQQSGRDLRFLQPTNDDLRRQRRERRSQRYLGINVAWRLRAFVQCHSGKSKYCSLRGNRRTGR